MKWLAILAALIIGAIIAYGMAYPSVTVRYRLSLEVEVKGLPKAGSGVIQVTYSQVPRIFGATAQSKQKATQFT